MRKATRVSHPIYGLLPIEANTIEYEYAYRYAEHAYDGLIDATAILPTPSGE